MNIAVIGDSACSAEEAKLAETVGVLLAERGATVICGGLGGVMEAVCRGAKSKGGMTVGILPGADSSMANRWVDMPVVTGMGEARNAVVVKSARAVIAIGGGYGTLSEIAYALKNGTPVIGLNTWSLSRNGREDDSIIRVQNASEAVDKAIYLASKHKAGGIPSPFSTSAASSPVKGEGTGDSGVMRTRRRGLAPPLQIVL
jgi:uncharacterized protein (TIGR00725 family)